MTANEYLKSIQDNFDGIEKNLKEIEEPSDMLSAEEIDKLLKAIAEGEGWEQVKKVDKEQPVTGKWIYEQEKEGLGNCRCSNCDRWYYTSNKIQWNFCPNCGCRMVEQKECEEV